MGFGGFVRRVEGGVGIEIRRCLLGVVGVWGMRAGRGVFWVGFILCIYIYI